MRIAAQNDKYNCCKGTTFSGTGKKMRKSLVLSEFLSIFAT